MNERIQELAEQAERYADDNFRGESTWTEAYESKFAELIVRECIDTLDQIPVYYKHEHDREIERNTISDCIRAIEERFRVK